MPTIKLFDKEFEPYITAATLHQKVAEIAAAINADYKDKQPLFIAILNGSFMFAADLFKHLSIDAQISFIKLASYKGTTSSGNVITAIGLEASLKDRHVIIIEDIIDTGKTLSEFLPQIKNQGVSSVKICALMVKPEASKYHITADYMGFEIDNTFVLGYGLDFDGYGRNLPEIYKAVE